jgi:uncharacterized membrane protein
MRWRAASPSPSTFGNTVIVLFLLAQAADGVMTYVGVKTMGLHIEANPLLAMLMVTVGQGAGVTLAKVIAGALGISLHLIGVHRVIAVLTVIYMIGAVVPWASLLLTM